MLCTPSAVWDPKGVFRATPGNGALRCEMQRSSCACLDTVSSLDYHSCVREPLDPAAARALIRTILDTGTVSFSRHALQELGKDDLTTVDAVNVLRGGIVSPGELERGTWRYRVRTARLAVVVAFRAEAELVVVTGWRVGRR